MSKAIDLDDYQDVIPVSVVKLIADIQHDGLTRSGLALAKSALSDVIERRGRLNWVKEALENIRVQKAELEQVLKMTRFERIERAIGLLVTYVKQTEEQIEHERKLLAEKVADYQEKFDKLPDKISLEGVKKK